MKFDRAYSDSFLERIQPAKVTPLYARDKYTPAFCAVQAITNLADCVEELETIFEEHPEALQMNYSCIAAEAGALELLHHKLSQRIYNMENV